ncbi:unnamed protein product [Discosporangium mesarthrocarpum]
MLRKYTFVGMVDVHLSLVQYNTKLVLINHVELSKEAFFQMALRRFSVMPSFRLETPVPVTVLIRGALELPEAGWAERDGDRDSLAKDAAALLLEKGAMLDEYFKINISRSGSGDGGAEEDVVLTTLPVLIEGHSPIPEGLPLFLLRLATEVDWTEERACFEGTATELALYYSTLPEGQGDPPDHAESETEPLPRTTGAEQRGGPSSLPDQKTSPEEGEKGGPVGGRAGGRASEGRSAKGASFPLAPPEACAVVQHTLLPSLRWALIPPKAFATDGTVVQVACLERLYKVFERC